MNGRNFDHLFDVWVEAGPTVAPTRVAEAVRLEVRATRQKVSPSWWPTRSIPQMNNAAKLAMGAGALVLVALLGIAFVTSPGNIGGPEIYASPTIASEPTPEAKQLKAGALEPGTYRATPFGPASSSIEFTFTVPDGWEAFDEVGLLPTTGSAGPDGVAIGFGQVVRLYSDPCYDNAPGASDVAVGPSVEDLVAALRAQTAYDTSQPTDITLGGYSGQKVDIVLPSDLDFTTCDGEGFYVWEGGAYAQGPGNRWHLWILDVEGTRVVVLGSDFETTPGDKRAEMNAIIDSIEINPQP
jgi:hypothetical protein